jgi:hypothetical protein
MAHVKKKIPTAVDYDNFPHIFREKIALILPINNPDM